MDRLRSALAQIDGCGYKAYKSLKGSYLFNEFKLTIDHVQGDPYAAPSRVSIIVSSDIAGFPVHLWETDTRKVALEDFLGRAVKRAIGQYVKGHRGIGKSGDVAIETGGQQILERNAILLSSEGVEIRFTVGLPARGRKILAREAEEMFFREVPRVVHDSLLCRILPTDEISRHVESAEDQTFLRNWLSEENLVAFIADNSFLPRRSGIDDRPLGASALPFQTPNTLSRSVTLPNAGPIRGMGIPVGVTLIVGGGFHGKSTLLHALERGVYNHVPNDGRERVVTDPTAVKIRAEDGRVINDVNISPFIDNLPFGRNTHHFTTENASGSTSQAANIIEALEYGARLLLIDEDTSATNFMIRDERMQALVAKDKEPITPFLHSVQELYHKYGVSSVIVMGGTGDYFEVSDNVIMMDAYVPHDVTQEALQLARPPRLRLKTTTLPVIMSGATRRPTLEALNASRGHRETQIDAQGTHCLIYGEHEIDLTRIEQLVDVAQTRAIGLLILYYAKHYHRAFPNMIDGIKHALKDIEQRSLDILSPYRIGTLALPRAHEVAAAINRIRSDS